MELTAANVQAIAMYCLYRKDEIGEDGAAPDGCVIAEGVVQRLGFHPARLQEKAPDIRSMLLELPEPFRSDKGGGWSFLQACDDRAGNQWGEHRDVDALLCLGIASGYATILLPREMWGAMPGSVPYFAVIAEPTP